MPQVMPDSAVMQQLCPTGKLRVAIAIAPSPSAQFAIKDGDTYKGVAVILGRALAAKLGVDAEIVPHNTSGEVQNAAANNTWDVAFMPVDPDRRKFVDFGNAYHLLQSTFLVASGSALASVKDADAAGIGVGGITNTASFRAATKATPKATHIEFAGIDPAARALREGRVQAFAASRESLVALATTLPGSRVLDDAFMSSTTSICVPKDKPAALAYVTEFIEAAKASGLVRRAFDEMGLTTSVVAPAGS